MIVRFGTVFSNIIASGKQPPDCHSLPLPSGSQPPYKSKTKDLRRMFLTEFTEKEQKTILNWFSHNKTLILSDIIRGRGQFCAEWILVAQKINNNAKWIFSFNHILFPPLYNIVSVSV